MPPRAAKRARLASPAAASTIEVTCPAPADLSASRSDAVRRLYEAGELCDGEVVHGDRTYKVSRMMLGAASQFFRAAFAHFSESVQQRVALDSNLSPVTVEALLLFAHCPGATMAIDPEEFAAAVDQLGFVELLPTVATALSSSLDPSNCVQRLVLADRHGEPFAGVLSKGVEVLSAHATELCPALASVSAELFASILCHDACTAPEAPLYEALLAWRSHDDARHCEAFDTLLEHVRLPSLGLDYLVDNVMHAPEVVASARAQKLVKDAIAYLSLPSRRATLSSPSLQPRGPGSILTSSEWGTLLGWLPARQRPSERSLLYQASRDGWKMTDLHAKCDNMGPTVVVVRAPDDAVFGGYTSVSWGSTAGFKADGGAFLFAMRGPHATEPVKLGLKPGQDKDAVCHYGHLLAFGEGHDMRIKEGKCKSNLGWSFQTPVGVTCDTFGSCPSFFTGTEAEVRLEELEVFAVAR